MNLWWLHLNASVCSFNELASRRVMAIGWPEIGSIARYLKGAEKYERRLKTIIQIKGDLAYGSDRQWVQRGRQLHQVPQVFCNFMHMKCDDVVIVIESNRSLSLGSTEVAGIGRLCHDAVQSYSYDKQYAFAHGISPGMRWFEWDNYAMGEPPTPKADFFTLARDDRFPGALSEMLDTLVPTPSVSS